MQQQVVQQWHMPKPGLLRVWFISLQGSSFLPFSFLHIPFLGASIHPLCPEGVPSVLKVPGSPSVPILPLSSAVGTALGWIHSGRVKNRQAPTWGKGEPGSCFCLPPGGVFVKCFMAAVLSSSPKSC